MPLSLTGPGEINAAKELRRQVLNQSLMQNLHNDALIGAGAGASAVGVAYLAKLLASSLRGPKKPSPQSDVLHIQQRKKQTSPLAKYSSQVKTAGVMDVLNSAVTGTGAKKVEQLPYGLPMRALALLAGAGGGAFLANKLGVNAKDVSLDNELAQARAEFEAALQQPSSNEEPRENTKLASAFSRIEKAAAASGLSRLKTLDKKAADELSGNI